MSPWPRQVDFARLVAPGDVITWGHGGAEPTALLSSLIEQRHGLGGRVRLFLTGVGLSELLRPEQADVFDFSGIGGLGTHGRLARAGCLDVVPVRYSDMPKLLQSGRLGIDVALVQASMPDSDGNISLGATVDLTHDVLACARLKIAEINPNVPFSLGNSLVSLDTFDACVYSEMPLVEAPQPAPAGPAERAIADRVVSLISSDSTVQLGIGSLALEVAKRLQRRQNLGIHSGIITDELMDLIVAGVADGSAKEIDAGRAVAGGLVGTRRLYDFVDHNPNVALRETSYVLSEEVLANFARFVSINSALQVDLSGQVNAESRSGYVAGAVGGQVDYVRAARRSAQGISIIALRSTTSAGESRIVTCLDRGVVTTARSEVDMVVTEHGMAELSGASLSERALRLVAVADPSHRRRLLDEMRQAT